MLFQRVITTSPRARPVQVKTFTLYWIRNKVILKLKLWELSVPVARWRKNHSDELQLNFFENVS